MKSIKFTAVFTAIVLLAACQKKPVVIEEPPAPAEVAEVPKEPKELPDNIKITDKQGRSLDVKIVGRSSEKISFIRLSDSKFFEWEISQLAEADQAIMKNLPMKEGPPNAVAAVQDSLYITNRKRDLIRVNKEIVQLQQELPTLLANSSKGISPRVKAIEKSIAIKQGEAATLMHEIEKNSQ